MNLKETIAHEKLKTMKGRARKDAPDVVTTPHLRGKSSPEELFKTFFWLAVGAGIVAMLVLLGEPWLTDIFVSKGYVNEASAARRGLTNSVAFLSFASCIWGFFALVKYYDVLRKAVTDRLIQSGITYLLYVALVSAWLDKSASTNASEPFFTFFWFACSKLLDMGIISVGIGLGLGVLQRHRKDNGT